MEIRGQTQWDRPIACNRHISCRHVSKRPRTTATKLRIAYRALSSVIEQSGSLVQRQSFAMVSDRGCWCGSGRDSGAVALFGYRGRCAGESHNIGDQFIHDPNGFVEAAFFNADGSRSAKAVVGS